MYIHTNHKSTDHSAAIHRKSIAVNNVILYETVYEEQ